MSVNIEQKQQVIQCWQSAVESVKGENATRRSLNHLGIKSIDNILAVGKAASSMCLGALDKLKLGGHTLVITKYGHVDAELLAQNSIKIIQSGHPIPDNNSLIAGNEAIQFVNRIPDSENLVLLVSGGASALIESLPEGIGLEDIISANQTFLANGFDIEQINGARVFFSGVKGGRLLDYFKGQRIWSLAISDVPSDDVEVIGSGIGGRGRTQEAGIEFPQSIQRLINWGSTGKNRVDLGDKYHCEIIASNFMARAAAVGWANQFDHKVALNEFTLNQDVEIVSDMISKILLQGNKGMYIWGGEPTIVLPHNPGRGGRSQSLSLLLAREISGSQNITIIVAGTDGSDGPTDAAGAVIDGKTFNVAAGAELALKNADAGSYLESVDALFKSGPTGTNVMDLVIAVVG